MMDVLAPIAGIPGVIGAAVFTSDDRCLAAMLHPPYEEVLVQRTMRALRQALMVLNASFDSEDSWSGMFLRCDGGHLVIKRVDDHALLVFGQPAMSVAMVNVGLNVAAIKLRAAPAPASASPAAAAPPPPPRQPPPPSVPPWPTPGSGSIPRSPTSLSQGVPMQPMSGSGSIPGAGTSMLSWPNQVGEQPAVGVLSRTTVEQLLRLMAKHVGPGAKVVMRDELVALGLAPTAVPFSSFSDLVDQLARHIQDASRRNAFMIEAELIGLHAR
ncbi:MAG: hypothetical protein R2939_16465 [Kofleriaceae bacterium]